MMKQLSDRSSFQFLAAACVLTIVCAISTAPSQAQERLDEYPPEDAPFEDSAEDLDPFGFLSELTRQKPAQKSTRASRAIIGGTWIAQGPGPAYSGQVEGITNLEVSGAIHTVIAHPTDPNIVWLGAVNGGVWKTTNAQAASPTWTQLTDTETSLSVGAMDLDPTDGTHQTIVVGIGRYSSFGRAGGPLDDGLLRSTDGGTTWTTISDPLLDGESCSGIAARGSTLLFASGENFGVGGLYRSTDTGASWSRIDGAGGTGLPLEDVHDLVGDPNVLTRFYLTLDDKGVYRSDDSGATWTNISDAAQIAVFSAPFNNNAELAVAPNGRVYVAIIISGQARAIEYTDNPTAGTPTWVAMDLPTTPTGSGKTITGATDASPIVITTSTDHGFGSGNYVEVTGVTGNTAANGIYSISSLSSTTFELRLSSGNGSYISGGNVTRVNSVNPGGDKPGSQGSIHFSILVDTSDSNTVYIGGDRQDLDSSPNFIGAFNFSGRLWRGDTTVTPTGESPSPQWEHLTHSDSIASIPGGGTASNSSPHADSREMVMDANGEIIEVDDGGIYRRTSPTGNTGDWFSMNGTVQTNEQHDVAYDTISNIIISGNQDTGTTQQQSPGSLTWDSVSTADGGDVAVDTTSVSPNSIRYSSFQVLQAFRRRTYNSSNVLQSSVLPSLTGSGGWSASFTSPVEINAVSAARIVIGGSNGILESLDMGDTVTYLVTAFINNDCLAYGANGMAEVLYAASGSTVLVRLSGSGAPVATAASFPGITVKDLVINPNDENTLYAIDSDQVFVTANAGVSWTDITGDLVNINLRAIEFMEGTTTSIVVGGQGGPFRMDVGIPGVWEQLGSGMPNVVVYDLDYDPLDDVLVAGTLGRGAWLLEDASVGVFAVTTGDFVSSGDAGGPFSPSCKIYNLANNDSSSIDWTASSNAFWLNFTPSSGTLVAGADIDVNVCVNALAVFAAPGDQVATITFTDTTNALDRVRGTTLAVNNPDDVFFVFNLDSDPGWTTEGSWAFGVPTGGGSSNGDPTSGHTGSNVYGYNLSGDYTDNLPETYLTTTALDFSNATGVTLTFWRWLGIESSAYDHASVRVSNNGSTWTTVWSHTAGSFSESSWSEQTIDISSVADNQSTVFVRWVMGTTDFSITFPGWNIDDVTISGAGPTLTMGTTVWVDFAYSGTENGSQSQPYNTFEEGRQAVNPGGTIKIQGGTSSETTTVQRPVTIEAVSGTVSIGVP